jgi:hypothetical protein
MKPVIASIRDLPRLEESAQTGALMFRQDASCADIKGSLHLRIDAVLANVLLKVYVRLKRTAAHCGPVNGHPIRFIFLPFFGGEQV